MSYRFYRFYQSHKDLLIASLIGFLVGWFSVPTLINLIGPISTIGLISPIVRLGLTVSYSLAIVAPAALSLFYFLSRFRPILKQISRYLTVGMLNAFLDLGLLNTLLLLTGKHGGWYFAFFKAISFLAAVTNSYFLTKFWTFGSQTAASPKEASKFLFFTLIGLIVNDGLASLMVNWIQPQFGLTLPAWENIASAVSVIPVLFWNFLSYRYLVFPNKSY